MQTPEEMEAEVAKLFPNGLPNYSDLNTVWAAEAAEERWRGNYRHPFLTGLLVCTVVVGIAWLALVGLSEML